MKNIATRIKQLRGKKSQEAFSADIGISQRALSRYETSIHKPSIELVAKICSKLGVETKWLIFGEGPMHTGEPVKEEPQAAPDLSLEAEVKMLKELLAAKNDTIDALKRVVAEYDSRGNFQPSTNRIQPMSTSESPPTTDAPKNGHTQEIDLE